MAEAVGTVRVVAMGIRAGIRCHTRTGLWIPYAKHFLGFCYNHCHESGGLTQFSIEGP